jgi:hypothetical protein
MQLRLWLYQPTPCIAPALFGGMDLFVYLYAKQRHAVRCFAFSAC